ncbi:alpha/beta fold hydrolase [Nonomuraea roseoviolacea]|uniref:Pimeloyl-ACP methyl ester carboxylesterase n=1 Tax=Nonomuraea roseoviolacea subsp. carminata TaxID=160689 RepID=A0ABT1JUA1_9ACTN|nr:alpha/beta hydrolase [Nonomuraea roseoviolacea]MCP2345290.1 pimeloyl-ACP methyl ester carboxylesterase [Nonomuraea roseoviolacea subsp. carminata]
MAKVAGLTYVDEGEGPVALFLHGVGTSSHLWRHVVAELRGERRCVAPDLPVHGGSDPREDLSLPALADAIEEFCAELGLGPVDLVANDTGGAVAQQLAVRHPARVRTLTLTNCDVHDDTPPPAFRPTVELAERGELAGLMGAVLERPELLSATAYGQSYERVDDPAAVVDAYLRPILGKPGGGEAFERLLTSIDAKDMIAIEPALTLLTVPALVVWGTGDVFFETRWARWLRDTIPGVRKVVEIEGGRLFFPEERAAELVPHLRVFWAAERANAGA